MANPSDWYARRLGKAPQTAPPSTPPAYPGRPDTQFGQTAETQLQRAQAISQNQRQGAEEALAMARSGQGNMMDVASYFQGTRAAENGTGNCPECGEDRLIKPGASYMPQCYNCGWNPRFTVYG